MKPQYRVSWMVCLSAFLVFLFQSFNAPAQMRQFPDWPFLHYFQKNAAAIAVVRETPAKKDAPAESFLSKLKKNWKKLEHNQVLLVWTRAEHQIGSLNYNNAVVFRFENEAVCISRETPPGETAVDPTARRWVVRRFEIGPDEILNQSLFKIFAVKHQELGDDLAAATLRYNEQTYDMALHLLRNTLQERGSDNQLLPYSLQELIRSLTPSREYFRLRKQTPRLDRWLGPAAPLFHGCQYGLRQLIFRPVRTIGVVAGAGLLARETWKAGVSIAQQVVHHGLLEEGEARLFGEDAKPRSGSELWYELALKPHFSDRVRFESVEIDASGAIYLKAPRVKSIHGYVRFSGSSDSLELLKILDLSPDQHRVEFDQIVAVMLPPGAVATLSPDGKLLTHTERVPNHFVGRLKILPGPQARSDDDLSVEDESLVAFKPEQMWSSIMTHVRTHAPSEAQPFLDGLSDVIRSALDGRLLFKRLMPYGLDGSIVLVEPRIRIGGKLAAIHEDSAASGIGNFLSLGSAGHVSLLGVDTSMYVSFGDRWYFDATSSLAEIHSGSRYVTSIGIHPGY